MVGGSIDMVPQKATHGKLRAIRQTRNLFHLSTRDLKNRGFNWHGARKSYPDRIARHPTDAKLVSLLYT